MNETNIYRRPSLTLVAGGSAAHTSEYLFTRRCAMQMVGGDAENLVNFMGVNSLGELPRYASGLLAAVAFGRITPAEMALVMQTVQR